MEHGEVYFQYKDEGHCHLNGDFSAVSAVTANLCACMGRNKDAVILRAITDAGETGLTLDNIKSRDGAIRHRGRIETYPDKTEVFVWDDKPLVKFMPMEITNTGTEITASQPYQLLYTPRD